MVVRSEVPGRYSPLRGWGHIGCGELAGLSGLLTAYRSSYDVRELVAQAFRALGRSESLCGLPVQSLAAKGYVKDILMSSQPSNALTIGHLSFFYFT